MRCVARLCVAVSLLLLIHVQSSHASNDPMKDLMKLMGRGMDLITDTSQRLTSSSTFVISQIGNFSDRIVYTEKLINNMGLQIGIMADRIVETERIVANLTRECFCSNKTSLRGLGKPKAVRGNAVRRSALSKGVLTSVVRHVSIANVYHPSLGGPWSQMIATMNRMVDLMDQMSRNMTGLLDYEVQSISTMGDRIVNTECLIMDMGKQIGVMADRIVETERLMANVSLTCCPIKDEFALALQKRAQSPIPMLFNVRDPPTNHCKPYNASALRAPRVFVAQAFDGWGSAGDFSDWPDPFAMMVKAMIDPMMNAMSKMMTSMSNNIIKGTDMIGNLADQIVHTEERINDMGLVIGQIADCIVATERIGFTLLREFCNGPRIADKALEAVCKPIHAIARSEKPRPFVSTKFVAGDHSDDLARQLHIVAQALLAAADQKASLPTRIEELHGIDPVADFAEMVKLCEKFMKMLGSIGSNMGTVMNGLMTGVTDMADRIMQTVDLIGDMADQINVMAGRIVETEGIVAQLLADCE